MHDLSFPEELFLYEVWADMVIVIMFSTNTFFSVDVLLINENGSERDRL